MNNYRILWTHQEDSMLNQLIETRKIKKWSQIAIIMYEEFHFPQRTGKQCNERWKNILAPTILKKEWTKQQQQLLFRLYDKMGTRWCEIVKQFQGRSQNHIKNHFYSKIRKSIRKVNNIMKQQKFTKQLRPIKPNQIFSILRLIGDRQKGQIQLFKKLEIQCNNIRKFILKEIEEFESSEQHLQRLFDIVKSIHDCSKQIQRASYKPIIHQLNQSNNLNIQNAQNAQNEITKYSKQQEEQRKNLYAAIQGQESVEYINLSPLRQQSPESEFMDSIYEY